MITVIVSEIRRAFRRRLTILIPVVPVALVAYAEIARWRHHSMLSLTPLLVILTASLLMFGQAILSDREGRFDVALRVAPIPGWFPTARRALLLAIPFILQFLLCRGLFRLVGLG
jgi:hypothetical protein